MISQIDRILNDWMRIPSFLSFFLFWLFFFLFLHFRFPRCRSFFSSIPIKIFFSFITSSFIKSSFSLHHVFLNRYAFLSFFISLSCHIQLFQSFSLRKLFSFIHLKYCSVVVSLSFPFYLYFFCVFRFSKLLSRFFFIPFFKTCIIIQRFGQTCMTKRNVDANEPFLC